MLRDLPREKLPWNEWKVKMRSGSLPGKSDENSAEQFMKHKELQSKGEQHVAWNERKSRPKTARHKSSRITFTEWLDNKKSSERMRPSSARAQSQERLEDDTEHEVHLRSSKSHEDWQMKKDLEVLEREEKLRQKAKIKFNRTSQQKF